MKNLSNRTKRILDLAKRTAENSEHDTFKHGAVLVKGGSIINSAYNKDQFCSFADRFRDPNEGYGTLHAEVASVLNQDRTTTNGATVYVVRINRKGEFRNSKPCAMCAETMKFCGIKKVVYTSGESTVEKVRL